MKRKITGHTIAFGSSSYISSAMTDLNIKIRDLISKGYEPQGVSRVDIFGGAIVVSIDMTKFGEIDYEETI